MEVYFVNKRLKLDFLWGTSDLIDVIDPKYGIKIGLRMRGQLGVRVIDYQYLHQTLIGTLMKKNYLTFSIVNEFFRAFINQKCKKILADEVITKKITYFEIQIHLDEIQNALLEEIRTGLKEYGFEIKNLAIENIDCPDDDLIRINEILHKKAELEQLGGSSYRTIRGYDVLESAAKGGGVAPAIVGVGLGSEIGKETNGKGLIPEETDNYGICPKCKSQINSKAKFCPECGTEILKQCPACKAKISSGQKFCPECGKKLYE